MTFRIPIGLAITSLGILSVFLGYQDSQNLQQDTTPFMQRKLDAAREIVAGLAVEDYNRLSRSAQDLMLLSQESEWNVIQTDRYLKMSNEFRSSAERLRDAAKEKNLDGATLAYFEVTLQCVRCHRYLREKPPAGGNDLDRIPLPELPSAPH